MGDFISLIKDLDTSLKEMALLILVQGSFWTIPFMLFKPKFFDFPFYAQIALIFALTIIWLIATLIASFQIISNYINPKANPLRLASLIAILLLNISILVGYYFSSSFTRFLCFAYGIMFGYAILVLIFFIVKDVRIEMKKSQR